MAQVREISRYEAEFTDFMTSSPTLEEIANFRLSDESEARLSALLEANRQGTLTAEEAEELAEYGRLEHLMRLMKYRAYEKLAQFEQS
jgi:hypothetical protein